MYVWTCHTTYYDHSAATAAPTTAPSGSLRLLTRKARHALPRLTRLNFQSRGHQVGRRLHPGQGQPDGAGQEEGEGKLHQVGRERHHGRKEDVQVLLRTPAQGPQGVAANIQDRL